MARYKKLITVFLAVAFAFSMIGMQVSAASGVIATGFHYAEVSFGSNESRISSPNSAFTVPANVWGRVKFFKNNGQPYFTVTEGNIYSITAKYEVLFNGAKKSFVSYIDGLSQNSYSPYGTSTYDGSIVTSTVVFVPDYRTRSLYNNQAQRWDHELYCISFYVNCNESFSNVTFRLISLELKPYDGSSALIEGDGTDFDSSGTTSNVDDAVGGVGDSTSAAMGGKSDAEVQADVDAALSFDDSDIDYTVAGKISGFFDGLLDVFGKKYKSLLLLSLTLGLAGFLIGRKW